MTYITKVKHYECLLQDCFDLEGDCFKSYTANQRRVVSFVTKLALR